MSEMYTIERLDDEQLKLTFEKTRLNRYILWSLHAEEAGWFDIDFRTFSVVCESVADLEFVKEFAKRIVEEEM